MKKLIVKIRIVWMQMEIERCKHAASEVNRKERELLHYRIKNAHLLPESMRYTFRRMT